MVNHMGAQEPGPRGPTLFLIQGVHKILCFFPENFVIFLNSASSAEALVFYLPGVCTHTDTEGKQSPEYFKIFEQKNTQYFMNTLYQKYDGYNNSEYF